MKNIFGNVPIIDKKDSGRYNCGDGSEMRIFENCSKVDYDIQCKLLEQNGYSVFCETEIKNNHHRTYTADKSVIVYFCKSENKLRVVTDPAVPDFDPDRKSYPQKSDSTLWQFEVDHSLIDCGMCYIIRCCDGSFFVIDAPHIYSVNDDVRIIDFLTKLAGGKPHVAAWFFSHAHDDHIAKFTDIIEFHKNEIDIDAVYCNFPSLEYEKIYGWNEALVGTLRRFETALDSRPDIKRIKLHTGQRFFIRNLEITVLCTHEDIFPNTLENFNNTSTALMILAQGTKILFPGDCADESDKVLVGRYGDYLKCDIVQVSHHGHYGTSPEFYRLANAECALFAITQIKFDEELPKQEANRVAVSLAKEYYIASNGTVEIPLPYVFGNQTVYPDETFEDFNGIFNLWTYEYTCERKQQLYNDFIRRNGESKNVKDKN